VGSNSAAGKNLRRQRRQIGTLLPWNIQKGKSWKVPRIRVRGEAQTSLRQSSSVPSQLHLCKKSTYGLIVPKFNESLDLLWKLLGKTVLWLTS